jgi:hypothetical protein
MIREYGMSRVAGSGRVACGRRWQASVALVVFIAAVCGDPSAPELATLQSGTIRFSVETTGGDVDIDGYEVVVGTGVRRAIAVNAVSVISDVNAGVHTVALEGVAENCEVSGSHSRSITVPPGGSVDVAFAIDCATTGIELSVRTVAIGVASPSTYPVSVDGRQVGFIGANGSLTASRLSPGSHNLSVTLAANCNVADGPQRTIEVSNRVVTPVLMDVACGPEPLPGSLVWLWGMVITDSGVCIVGATATVVGGQGVGQSIPQETPCDAWAYSGGFLFTNLIPGVPMTIRASAPGFADREMTVIPSSGPQQSVLFVLPYECDNAIDPWCY